MSKDLETLLHDRSTVLEGARLARETSTAAISQLRKQCDVEMKRRKKLLNRTNATSMQFLSVLDRKTKALREVLAKEVAENDMEAQHAASLSAQVDAAAMDCTRAMERLTSRVVKNKVVSCLIYYRFRNSCLKK